MRSKLSWIPFVPLFLAAGFFKLAQELLPQGSVFGLTALQMEYCYIGAAVLILLFTVLFVAVDKKISPYYVPHKNVPAGLIGILLSVLLAADGGLTAFQMFNSGTISAVPILGAVLAILSAVVFIIFSLDHIFRRKEGKNLSLLNAVPAVFCGVRMILVFIQFTTISIKLADVSALICYVFATLFFYHYAVVLSLIKNKSSLKSCFVFGLPAVAMMIPYQVTQVPLYILIANKLKMTNTYAAMILPGIVTSYNIFLAKQFFQSIPTPLIDSAKLDGCNQMGIFIRIVLPLSKTVLAVMAINTFMSSWNTFFWPFLVTSKEQMFTIQVGLKTFKFANETLFAPMMAGATLSALPMFILFFALQKYFLEGVTIGAVKG